jgi:TolB-like protein
METANNLPRSEIFGFGTFEINVATGELRKRGIRIALQDQPLHILSALLERPGEVITREDLCRRLWPDGTFVDFQHSLNAAVRRLRVTLGDEAEVPRFVETVHKRGYRFIATSEVLFHPLEPRARPASPATIAHIARRRPRLAVLPFGPGDVFTDGLTEEAITQLAQCCPRSIGVIARASVERAQRDGGGAAEIGRALSADYLVEGSVRRDGDRLRVTAQLIESEEETHLWARTFDRVMTDALSTQTDLAQEIARAVTEILSATAPTAAVG